jgi:sugar phosphate isomerase/epimerase
MRPPLRLEVFQALWAMQQRRPGVPERLVEQSFAMIAEAGYDGVGIDLGVTPLEQAVALAPLFPRYRLGCLITAFVKTLDGLNPVLDLARRLDARHVNLIGQVMPLSAEATVPVARRWMEMAAAAGVELQFETHRNSITNDMFATLQLLDAVPEMVISADLSHYVVGREFDCPPDARTESHVARLNFLCELGPHEYAMTGPDGLELSDRWGEALVLKAHVRRLWSGLDTESNASASRTKDLVA